VMGAQNATLAFMAGGRKVDFDRSIPLLKAMGAKQFHCGDVGSGQDLELASGMALNIRSPIPLGAVATQLYRIVQSRGYGHKDFSYIFQLLKEEGEKKK
ncbi:3-hydroxyisobutyrate dehydrogenase, partial [Operophtera brumata]